MHQLAQDIPGQPHQWAECIHAWADGRLVQWRYKSAPHAEPEHYVLAAGHDEWRDCSYANAGEPNWWNPALEYRVAIAAPPAA